MSRSLVAGLLAAVSLSLAPFAAQAGETADIVITAEDGLTVYGTAYFADLGEDAPLIALFHQGGSNGRGEYGPIVPWLNEAGYRAIAWDLRKGGELYGSENRTATFETNEGGFCEAWPDVKAAVANSAGHAGDAPLILFGSSYSGSLVFRAAAENPAVDGVIGFSPASGGPVAECRAALYVGEVDVPAMALRPDSEMARDGAVEEMDMFEANGVNFVVINDGVHGASMLVDERSENAIAAREIVLQWLDETTGAE